MAVYRRIVAGRNGLRPYKVTAYHIVARVGLLFTFYFLLLTLYFLLFTCARSTIVK
jgi:hypothetical protein